MEIIETNDGFRQLVIEGCKTDPFLWESKSMGPYPDAIENPGSSFLVFPHTGLRLDREEILQLKLILDHWLKEKRLPLPNLKKPSHQEILRLRDELLRVKKERDKVVEQLQNLVSALTRL